MRTGSQKACRGPFPELCSLIEEPPFFEIVHRTLPESPEETRLRIERGRLAFDGLKHGVVMRVAKPHECGSAPHTDFPGHEAAMVPETPSCSCFCGNDTAVFGFSSDPSTSLYPV